MNKIPAEIFISIISLLRSSDRLNCIRVCKKWYELITTTVLYDRIELKGEENLQKALILFNNKQYIGQHVNDLRVLWTDANMQDVLSFPALFPNIRSLDWKEKNRRAASIKSINHTAEPGYEQVLENWKHLERIVYSPGHLRITTYLLKSSICANLKYLAIAFCECSGLGVPGRSMLEELIESIHNAPALERIAISNTAIILTDLENLHDALPKLKELELQDVYLYSDEPVNCIISKPANHLESFLMKFLPRDHLSNGFFTGFERTIAEWISYAGQKYSNVQQFEMISRYHHIHDLDVSNNSLQQPLSTALSNMMHVTSYAAGVCHLTERILNTMKMNGVNLKKKILWLGENEQTMQVLQLIQFSGLTLSLENLEINITGVIINTAMLSSALNKLPNNLAFLTHLTIHNGENFCFFVNILQNLVMLETLIFGSMRITSDDKEALDTLDNTTIKQCRLKVLTVQALTEISIGSLNDTFRFVLQSCPLLEQFHLSGLAAFMSDTLVTFNLCFLNNTRIRDVNIDMAGFDYYTFNEEQGSQGKKWWCYNDDHHIEAKFSPRRRCLRQINLIWKGLVKLRLIDCSEARNY